MKKIIDWLYWTGNRYFIITNFVMGAITLISFAINDEYGSCRVGMVNDLA